MGDFPKIRSHMQNNKWEQYLLESLHCFLKRGLREYKGNTLRYSNRAVRCILLYRAVKLHSNKTFIMEYNFTMGIKE